MDTSSMSYLFLRQPQIQAQRPYMGTEGYGVVIHDNLAGAGCHDASGDLDYEPIDYK